MSPTDHQIFHDERAHDWADVEAMAEDVCLDLDVPDRVRNAYAAYEDALAQALEDLAGVLRSERLLTDEPRMVVLAVT
jgi:hypothetical protein